MGQQQNPNLQEWPRLHVKVLLETTPSRATSSIAHWIPQVPTPGRRAWELHSCTPAPRSV